jgi:tetratricopeptide (TPR) repeat protein
VQLDPGLDGTYKDLGKIYYDEGKFQESINVLQKAAAHDSDGSVYYLLFKDYSQAGKQREAAVCLKQFQHLKVLRQNKELLNAQVATREASGADPALRSPEQNPQTLPR